MVSFILQLSYSVKHPDILIQSRLERRGWMVKETAGCVLHCGGPRGKTIAETSETVRSLMLHLLLLVTAQFPYNLLSLFV